jgi:hypothetical protein
LGMIVFVTFSKLADKLGELKPQRTNISCCVDYRDNDYAALPDFIENTIVIQNPFSYYSFVKYGDYLSQLGKCLQQFRRSKDLLNKACGIIFGISGDVRSNSF